MLLKIKNIQMRSIFRFTVVLTGLVLFFRVIFLYLSNEDTPKRLTDKQKLFLKYVDFSCHYLKENDSLPKVGLADIPQNSIFFIEASCDTLKSYQACSVESAARANPDRQVNLLFTSPVSWDVIRDSVISVLLAVPNIDIARIHIERYAVNTPLAGKFKMKPTSEDDFNMDLPDILKFLTLYKYDGVFLEMDVVVARSFNDLGKNWVLKTNPASISADIFSFSENKNGRVLAELAVNLVVSDLARREKYNDIWIFDGKSVMKSLLGMWCRVGNILYQNTLTCPDVHVIEPEQFYPISVYNRHKYMSLDDWDKWRNKDIFFYQIWDKFTKDNKLKNESLYARLVQEYCPHVFEYYGEKFGIL